MKPVGGVLAIFAATRLLPPYAGDAVSLSLIALPVATAALTAPSVAVLLRRAAAIDAARVAEDLWDISRPG